MENPGGAYQHNGMNRHFPDIVLSGGRAVPTLLIIRIPIACPCLAKTGAGGDL